MLNDGVLGELGIAPIVITGVSAVLPKIVGMFGSGPTAEFQERQAFRDVKDQIVAEYLAVLPTLPDWQRRIVSADLDEFVFRMTRGGMKSGDYQRELAWWEGRQAAWQAMTPADAEADAVLETAHITPEMMYRKMHPTGPLTEYQQAVAAGILPQPVAAAPVTAAPAMMPELAGPSPLMIAALLGAIVYLMRK